MQDTITREITIKASQQKVYEAISSPEQIVKWFPDTIEGTLQQGDSPILGFGEFGKTQIYVEAARPYELFSYRWVPGANHYIGDVLQTPHTLVEFTITESGGVTKVVMTESGFAQLPAQLAEESFKQNSGGWDYMLGRLNKYFNAK